MFLMGGMVWGYLAMFSKKIIVLLSLEGVMLSAIGIMIMACFSKFSSFFLLILFSIMMVLDSVFGISLMVLTSRSPNMSEKLLS